jgi:DNA-binding transcriptional LysR family regulator
MALAYAFDADAVALQVPVKSAGQIAGDNSWPAPWSAGYVRGMKKKVRLFASAAAIPAAATATLGITQLPAYAVASQGITQENCNAGT